MPNKIKSATLCLLCLFIFSGCAGLQKQITVGPEEGTKVIEMEASSFKFSPNNIKASQGDSIIIKITSVSDIGHNFTLKDPIGEIVQSVDIPSKQTVEARVTLSLPGVYEFYCDKPLHSSFGMKGQIEVMKK